jgi:septum formation protein
MLILGSNSQGRKKLLSQITTNFLIIPSDFDEDKVKKIYKTPARLVTKLSLEKLKVLVKLYPNDTIICADTCVYQKGIIYGKPEDRENAKEMLLQLSRYPHWVYSSASIYLNGKITTLYDKTKVTFNHLTSTQIDAYLDTNDYIGKAGSYGIQSLNDSFVKRIDGSFSNIIGLPLEKIKELVGDIYE